MGERGAAALQTPPPPAAHSATAACSTRCQSPSLSQPLSVLPTYVTIPRSYRTCAQRQAARRQRPRLHLDAAGFRIDHTTDGVKDAACPISTG